MIWPFVDRWASMNSATIITPPDAGTNPWVATSVAPDREAGLTLVLEQVAHSLVVTADGSLGQRLQQRPEQTKESAGTPGDIC